MEDILIDNYSVSVFFVNSLLMVFKKKKEGKTEESPTTILIQRRFKNYELKWGFGGLPPIIMLNLYQFGWI